MLYSLSIRHSHSANGYRLAGPVGSMTDLKLPLLAPLMAALKHAKNFIGEIGKCRRENLRSIVRLLSLWSRAHQAADQQMGLAIHVQNLQQRRKHHNSQSS